MALVVGRVLRFGFWGLLVPLLLILALVAFLLFTHPGARLVLNALSRSLPQLTIDEPGGTIAHGLRASRVIWRDESGVVVHLEGLATVWNPRCLLRTTFCVDTVAAGSLRIEIPPGDYEYDGHRPYESIPLPLLVLPWHLQIQQLFLGEIRIQTQTRTNLIGPVQLRARWAGSRVTVEQLRAAMNDTFLGAADATLSGTIDLRSEWPLALTLAGRYVPPLADWQEQRVQLSGQGNLSGLQLQGSVNADLAIPGLPPLALVADGHTAGLDTALQLRQLEGEYRGAPLAAQGGLRLNRSGELQLNDILARWGENRVRLQGQLTDEWDVTGELVLAQPALIAPDAKGRLDGSLRLTGPAGDPLVFVQGTSAELSLPGLQLQQLTLDARVTPVTFRQLQVDAQAQTLVTGSETLRGLDLHLAGTAASHQLALRTSVGQHSIDTTASGSLNPDTLDWKGEIATLALQLNQNWPLALREPVAVQWQHQQGRLLIGHNCLGDGKALLCSSLDHRFPQNRSLATLDVSALDLTRLKPWLPADLRLKGTLDTHLKAQGQWRDPELNGDLRLTALEIYRRGQKRNRFTSGEIQATFSGRRARIENRFNLPPELHWQGEAPLELTWKQGRIQAGQTCWQGSRPGGEGEPAVDLGSLCLAADYASKTGLKGQATADLDLAGTLLPWLPDGLDVQGRLTARADAHLQGRDVRLNLDARADGGSLILARNDTHNGAGNDIRNEGTTPLSLPFQTLQLNAALRDAKLDTRLELVSTHLGNGDAQARIALDQPGYPVDLSGRLDAFQLGVLAPLFPRLNQLAGQISAQAHLYGPLAAPRIDGSADLQNLQAQTPLLPLGIDDLDARLTLNGDHGELQGTLASGEGTADLTGQLQLAADTGWKAALQLHGRNIAIRQPPDFILEMQPDLTLEMDAQRLHLGGTLALNEGFIWIKELPEGAVSTSSDVVFVDEEGTPLPASMPLAMTTDLTLIVKDKLRLRGFGGDVKLNGQVRVLQDASGLLIGRGAIDVTEGSYTGYGQQLTIRRGKLLFNGPLDRPFLSLEAIRKVDNVVAGLRVIGPATEPVATLFSEPSLPDSQILYYIITGKAPGTGTAEDNTMVQNALLSLSLMGGQSVVRNVASKVGIQDLQMGTSGSGQTTEVQVSGYLSRRTYLQYGISMFQPVNTLTLRYRLRDNLFLEAVSGLASALDLLYTFEF